MNETYMNNADINKIYRARKRQRIAKRLKEIWRCFCKNKAAMLGLIIMTVLILVIIFANWIAPYESAIAMDNAAKLQGPSAEHWFGTDNLGRDIFARIVQGARYSMLVALITVAVSYSLGCIIGCFAGYSNNMIDNIIMRIADIFESIPPTLMSLSIVAVLGTSFGNLILALSISTIPSAARLVRACVLTVAQEPYVEAARSYDCSTMRIMLRYMLPNIMGPVIVRATMAISTMMIAAAGLSFLGMGAQPPTPEWGSMLSESTDYLRTAPHMMYISGLAILLAALSFNLTGDGLRDALDPRLKN